MGRFARTDGLFHCRIWCFFSLFLFFAVVKYNRVFVHSCQALSGAETQRQARCTNAAQSKPCVRVYGAKLINRYTHKNNVVLHQAGDKRAGSKWMLENGLKQAFEVNVSDSKQFLWDQLMMFIITATTLTARSILALINAVIAIFSSSVFLNI